MEVACPPKHLYLSVTRGRWICHKICKRKLKWGGGRMEATRHSGDRISKHNIANNIKMCHCHWRLGIWCLYKSLHFSSWLLLSALKEGDSHYICHVIRLVISVLTITLINLHEGSGTDRFLGVWACHFGMWCCWPMRLIVIVKKCQKFTRLFHAVIKGSWNLTYICKSAILSLFLNNWFFIIVVHWYQQCRLYLPPYVFATNWDPLPEDLKEAQCR